MLCYNFRRQRDDNGTVLITVPDLPEVTTFAEGGSFLESAGPAASAIEEALAARIAAGVEIPPALAQGSDYVTIADPLIEAKVELYRALRASGISRAELARRLGWHREQVDRLFRLDHASRLDQIDKALRELGLRLDLSVEPLEARRA